MCKAIEDMRAEERREVSIDIALRMLKDGALAIEKIAEYSGLTVDEVKAIWISGTLHNIYSIGMALEQEGFKIINNITWQKTNPPPNLACRCFTHSTETILWAKKNEKKSRHFFDYQKMKEMNDGKQMKDVWTGALTKPSEKTEGNHPTQKPEYLLEKIVLASTEEGQVILDPFCGSGTTGVESVRFGRKFVGIDVSEEYLEMSKKRLEKAANGKILGQTAIFSAY